MQKNTTIIKSGEKVDNANVAPKESTISFLKQFAKVCVYKKMRQPELGHFVMN